MIVNLTPHPLHIYPPDTPTASPLAMPLRCGCCHRRRGISQHGWDAR